MALFDFFKKKKNTVQQQESYSKVGQKSSYELSATEHTDAQNSTITQEPKRESYYNLEDIKTMKMEDYMICPYDAGWFFQAPDAEVIPTLANSTEIRKYLPGLKLDTAKSCKNTLKECLMKTEAGLGITYVIRHQNFPIGMIILSSPLYNEKAINLRIWTIDFFIIKMFEHHGIMYNSLKKVLYQVKNMNAKYVYATIDQTNKACINLLGNGFFTEIDNSHFYNKEAIGEKPLVYRINLCTDL